MFNAKINQIFSLLITVKYAQEKPSIYDYSCSPRPCHNFMFMLSGEGEVTTKSNKILLKKGDFLFIPKDTTYISKWTEKTEFRSIHFNFTPQTDPLINTKIPIQKIALPDFTKALSLADTLSEHQFSNNEKSFLAISSFYELCSIVLPLCYHEDITETTSIDPAIEYISEHYKEKLTVEELARLCYLSPSRFYYLFKKQTGYPPIVFKNRRCILEACGALLLDRTKSVEEISLDFGFESAVYFRRLFKSVTGKTPTQYRTEETLL